MIVNDSRDTSQSPNLDFANLKPSADGAVLTPEDVGKGHGGAPDGAVVTKKESCCWNCNTSDHTLELMKCKGCNRVRFFSLALCFYFSW